MRFREPQHANGPNAMVSMPPPISGAARQCRAPASLCANISVHGLWGIDADGQRDSAPTGGVAALAGRNSGG